MSSVARDLLCLQPNAAALLQLLCSCNSLGLDVVSAPTAGNAGLYLATCGEQSTVQKMMVILLNRMRVFYRSPYQWFVLVIPLIYVLIQLFIAYSVIVTVTKDDSRE